MRVAFLTTHPIQYQVPVFRVLAKRQDLEFSVLYAMIPDARQQGDGFGVTFEWDLPLLEGYEHEVLRNRARAPSTYEFSGCDTPNIGDVIARRRLDALVVNGWVAKSCLQGLGAARRAGIPCLVRGEANLIRPRAWWKSALHRRLLRRYAAYLYIGRANRAFYEHHGATPDQLFRSPYCIENDRFATQAAALCGSERDIRERLGVPLEATCFLFSGKLIAKKHPLELLHAFLEVRRQRPDVHLLIVGDGELRPACETFAREHGLPVTFAGFLNQTKIVEAYVAADCLVLPSDHGETWGLVVNEAMACGRPAIVSNQVGCQADLIIDGQTGFTFPFGDWKRLAATMLHAARCRAALREMGTAARRHVANYSPAAAAAGIAEAVHAVVERRVYR